MSSNKMYAGRIFDAEVIAGGGGGTATSAAIRMTNAETMSIHTQVATTGGTIDVGYTYELSSSDDASAVWTAGEEAIASAGPGATKISDFAPEASKFIRIIATNNDAAAVTLTAVLNMQES